MHKLLTVTLSILLCISLSSCGSNTEQLPLPETPGSEPIESRIEPVEHASDEAPVEIETEPESESNSVVEVSSGTESVSEVMESVPNPESAPAAPKAEESPSKAETSSMPEPPQSPVQKPVSEEEPPQERLNAIAKGKKMDSGLIERELLRMINAEREAVGVEVLGEEDTMKFTAKIRAGEALQTFSHTRPNGTPYNTAFDEAGFSYAGKWHGENLASVKFTEGMFDEKSAALEMFTGLKNSKGHYQNMVSENYYQIGVGVAITYSDGMVDIASAQLFSSL